LYIVRYMALTKRLQILNAAMDCFSTYGYEKTTMSDIGARVGMNKASLYYHFKDKIALFATMVD
jgi:AcrR family transcriptional regulator